MEEFETNQKSLRLEKTGKKKLADQLPAPKQPHTPALNIQNF
jgi:hypothetical protein